jgi:hypothetical protein
MGGESAGGNRWELTDVIIIQLATHPVAMDIEIRLLHYLAMEGLAEDEALIGDIDESAGTLQATLDELEANGDVENEGFWYLTDAGEDRLNQRLRERFSEAELEDLEAVYEEFETFDTEFKTLANEWQRMEASAGRDELIDELLAFHERVDDFFADREESIRDVYRPYLDELEAATEKLTDGDENYFTGTEVDSYHTVWFRLHDDLLRTLGKDRDE